MAEQRFCKPWVGGSTPSTGSTNDRADHGREAPVARALGRVPAGLPRRCLRNRRTVRPGNAFWLVLCGIRGIVTPGWEYCVDKTQFPSYYFQRLTGQALAKCLKTEKWGCGTAATAADCKSAPSGFLGSSPSIPTSARVAQSVEHFVGNEEVTGSNPVAGSIFQAYGTLPV